MLILFQSNGTRFMKQLRFVFLISTITVLVLGLLGCESPITTTEDVVLQGSWNEIAWEDDAVQVLMRSQRLDGDKFGITFNGDGSFVECAIGGRCATPPVSYYFGDGRWASNRDDTIGVDVSFWNGMKHYTIKVIEITDRELRIQYRSIEYEANDQ